MINATKVKTYTPHIPAGQGPTFTKVEDAIAEMVRDLYDDASEQLYQADEDKLVSIIVKAFELNSLIDGSYEIMLDKKLVVETMPQYRLDEMAEFNGY